MLTISLPYDYEVAWVHGDGQVWFDTGLTIDKRTKIVVNVACDKERSTADKSIDCFFGSGKVACRRSNGYYSFLSDGSNWNQTNVLPSLGHLDQIVYDLTNKKVFINGIEQPVTIDTSSWGTLSQGKLLLMNIDQSPMKVGLDGKFKSAQVYQNGTIVGDFYPVMKSSTLFLYNAVSGVFLSKLGTGVASAGDSVTTHDADFTVLMGKEAGAIPGDERVMTPSYLKKAYKKVEVLPAASYNQGEVIMLTKPLSGFGEGQILISERLKSGWSWVSPSLPDEGVGVVSNIKSRKVGNRVMIRWDDPTDVYDEDGKTIRRWKKTRLLRKMGKYPSSQYDGVLVAESTVRNYYSSSTEENRQLIDDTPPNVSEQWYYKFFTFSEDGVVSTSSASQFIALEFDWAKMHQYIQNNQARDILAVGDILEFEAAPFTGDNAVWNNLQLSVAGFDVVTPASTMYKHTVTLVARFIPTLGSSNKDSVFDLPWGTYHRITNDVVTSSTTKKYYIKNGSTYQEVKPSIGTIITPTSTPHYFEKVSDSRTNYGSNCWSTSKMREWLNATSLAPTGTSYITSVLPILMAVRSLSESFASCLIAAQNVTAVNSTQRKAGSSIEYTTDYAYLPSITNVTGLKNGSEMEGQQFPLFKDTDEYLRTIAGTASPLRWWFRSPSISSLSETRTMSPTGTTDGVSVAADANGAVIVLTIG